MRMTYDRIGRPSGQFPPTQSDQNELIQYTKNLARKVKQLEDRLAVVEAQKRTTTIRR